jgi:alpha-ribazole phosphatase
MIIDLLRHGEPQGGVRYRGHGCDDPLSERGWRQMWAATGESPRDWEWDAVLSSPLARCREFAEALSARGAMPLQVLPDLREIGFGEWEGMAPDVIRTRRPAEYQAFFADPSTGRPPGAEPLRSFRERVEAALWAAAEAGGAEHLLVVAHAGVTRAAIGRVLQTPDQAFYRLDCGYASLSRIVRDPERGWRVGFINRGC